MNYYYRILLSLITIFTQFSIFSFANPYIDEMWQTTRVQSIATASNFNSWPDKTSPPKGGINLRELMVNLGYPQDSTEFDHQKYICQDFSVWCKQYENSLNAQKDFLIVRSSATFHRETDPIKYSFDIGNVCEYNIDNRYKPLRNNLFFVINNYAFSITSASIDSIQISTVANLIISYVSSMPNLNSIDLSQTRPIVTDVFYPDNLISEVMKGGKNIEICKIFINNPIDFRFANLEGWINGIRHEDNFYCEGVKETASDTIRFSLNSIGISDTEIIDSLRIFITIHNLLGESADTTFFITR